VKIGIFSFGRKFLFFVAFYQNFLRLLFFSVLQRFLSVMPWLAIEYF